MPFGMMNAPATFQRIINHAIQGLEGGESYLDDIVVYSDSWKVHLTSLQKLLERLSSSGFTLNLAKALSTRASFARQTLLFGGQSPSDALMMAPRRR